MAKMDWTRTFVAAPGLRPTASDAFMPMNPTPRAAKPTCRFPLISANIGISVIFSLSFFLSFSLGPAIEHGRAAEIRYLSVRVCRFLLLVLANKQGEERSQQHENQGLNNADQQFQEVERNWQQPPKAGDQ